MAKQIITPAMVELRAAITEAEGISAKSDLTKRDEARINVLLAKIAALRNSHAAPAPDDTCERWFKALLSGGDPCSVLRHAGKYGEIELRSDLIEAGATPSPAVSGQTITYTEGGAGGYLVPQEYYDTLVFAIQQYDPLLDEKVVTLIKSKGESFRPFHVPGWDMTSLAAVKVAEAGTQTPVAVPTAATAEFKGGSNWLYRQGLDASWEFEADDFQPTMDQITAAFGIAFARGIGADLVTGDGVTGPQGILNAAVDSGVTLDPTVPAEYTTATNVDFQPAYFSVDAAYRASDKCAWAMNDKTYQWVRKLSDDVGRPLLRIEKDKQTIMGKPVLICPSLPYYRPSLTSGKIVFGDFSRLFVRVSKLSIVRKSQAPGYVEYGKALYTGRMRADSKVMDASGGSVPPFTYITLTA